MRINKDKFQVEQDQLLNECSVEELADELPDNQPRFVVFSYCHTHADGRISYPLLFFYYSPVTVKPETHMLYASAKTHVVQACDIGKVSHPYSYVYNLLGL